MNIKKMLIDFVITFIVALVISAIVSFLYSLIVHGAGTVDWGSAFRMAIILGIILPWFNERERKAKSTI